MVTHTAAPLRIPVSKIVVTELPVEFIPRPMLRDCLEPPRELLGDMLLELGRPADALPQYEASIAKEPNRFRGLYGAGLAAERAGDRARARVYFEKLMALCAESDGTRPELVQVRQALAQR